MTNSTSPGSSSAVPRDTLNPGATVGVVVGIVGIFLGLFIGFLYQRYLSPNYVQLLIDSRQRRRNQKIHTTLSNASQDSSSHGLVQLTGAHALDSLSIDFDAAPHYQPPSL